MIKLLAAIFLIAVFSTNADTQPRGADRLRELVVFPEMNLNFSFGISWQENEWVISKNVDLPGEIIEQTKELKKQPDNVRQLLHLAYLLDSNGETNKSWALYQKTEQLCREKAAANPRDGLNLTDLGEALWQLDKNDEAESAFRKATLVSSNDWKCWVSLGNFLPNEYFFSMFPTNLSGQIVPGQMPSQEVLDYWPSAEALKKAETACDEASRSFERAMILAPKEPEVFFQYAGFLSSSNWQNCFFRHYRDYKTVSSQKLLMAFFSPETIANLKKSAELKQKDYQYISLAAYFEYSIAAIEANNTNFTASILPDKTRQSIHNAMSHLENLSEDPDKKTAAGALENLGFLNMAFENKPAAAADFRRAVALDPTREQSWDLFLATAGADSREEAVAVCEARLKQKDSSRNRLLLARAFEHQKKWDQAGEHSEAALKLEPENIVAHLELTALDLTQSTDTNFFAKAYEQCTHAEAAFEKLPDNAEKQSRWRELTLNLAILDGLVNTPEYQKAARVCLKAVLKNYPDDKRAREISKALD